MPKNQKKRTTIGKGWKAATPGQDEPIAERQRGRKIRRDADTPRMNYRDILAFQWIGEQGAASSENLQELLGRPDMRELLESLAGGATKETEKLSTTRIRHIIEDRWASAGMVNFDNIMGKRWVWPTRRALYATELPFSPYLPANLWYLHHVNRIRLYLERLSRSNGLHGHWESERWYEHNKREWRAMKKEDTHVSVRDVYRMSHTPVSLWTFRNAGDMADSSATIEVEVSAKRPEALKRMLRELAIYGGTVWFFVEMNPKHAVFSGLMKIFKKLDDQYKSRFFFYDLAEPGRLVYHFE